MPFIRMDEIEKLIQVENYLGDKENWSENTTKLWEVVEALLQRQNNIRDKQRLYMKHKRATDIKYSRKKGKQNGTEEK